MENNRKPKQDRPASKKLTLQRTTLRALNPQELAQVMGGDDGPVYLTGTGPTTIVLPTMPPTTKKK
jgi:hypothetical protein